MGRKPKQHKQVFKNGKLVKKTCTQCNESKELGAFPIHLPSKDGHGSWCNNCVAAYNRRNYTKAKFARYWRKKGAAYFTSLIDAALSDGETIEQIQQRWCDKWNVTAEQFDEIFSELYLTK